MNNPVEGFIAALLAVLALIAVFSLGRAVHDTIHDNKIIHQCQNFGKFTAEGKVYECKEVGVAK